MIYPLWSKHTILTIFTFPCWSAMKGGGEGVNTIAEQVRDWWTKSIRHRLLMRINPATGGASSPTFNDIYKISGTRLLGLFITNMRGKRFSHELCVHNSTLLKFRETFLKPREMNIFVRSIYFNTLVRTSSDFIFPAVLDLLLSPSTFFPMLQNYQNVKDNSAIPHHKKNPSKICTYKSILYHSSTTNASKVVIIAYLSQRS